MSPRPQVLEDVREHAGTVAVTHDQQVRRRRPRREVHDVGHLAGVLERRDDADGLGGDGLLRLIGGRADVVRPVDVRQTDDRIARTSPAPPSGSPRKTSRPTRTPRVADGRFERVLVDDLGARRVDQECALLQPREQRRVDQPSRLWRKRQMHADDVAAVDGILGRRRQPDGEVVRPRIEAERREVHGAAGQVAAPDDRCIPNARARTATSCPMFP